MLHIETSTFGRLGIYAGEASSALAKNRPRGTGRRHRRSLGATLLAIPGWMIRGYQQANAGDLAAALAFNAIVALVPTMFLLFSIAGLFLKVNQVLVATMYASFWGLPHGAAQEALETALTARNNSGWFGVISLIGFAWVGTGFVSCLARCMNRIYGVRNAGFVKEKQRGFFVILVFALFFLLSLITSIAPSFFVNQTNLPYYFEEWALRALQYQVAGYAIALVSALVLFLILDRTVPNAGQHLADVWPGALLAATLFVLMAQVFPIYIRMVGGGNRYGVVLGLVSLLVAWFLVLAHVMLFGTYVNATWQRHRRRRLRQRRMEEQAIREQREMVGVGIKAGKR
jgi:membrane protein